MTIDGYSRLWRALWLATFYVLVGAVWVLAALDWQRYAEALMWLGLLVVVNVGAMWSFVFPLSSRNKRARTPLHSAPRGVPTSPRSGRERGSSRR